MHKMSQLSSTPDIINLTDVKYFFGSKIFNIIKNKTTMFLNKLFIMTLFIHRYDFLDRNALI